MFGQKIKLLGDIFGTSLLSMKSICTKGSAPNKAAQAHGSLRPLERYTQGAN